MLTDEVLEELRRNVLRGAAWLDAKNPSWWAEIDLVKLEMSNCTNCVLGQLYYAFAGDVYSHYYRTGFGYGRLLLDMEGLDVIDLGFTADYRPGGRAKVFAELRHLWIEQIDERRRLSTAETKRFTSHSTSY
jgi:hypothetical protein